jgi:hypothetical protein
MRDRFRFWSRSLAWAYCGEALPDDVCVTGSIDVELETVPPSASGSGDIDHELATIRGLSRVDDVAVVASAPLMSLCSELNEAGAGGGP